MNGGDGDKIVYVVFKYISRSLLQKRVGAGVVTPPHTTTTLFTSWPRDFSFKDDITVIFLLDVSFMALFFYGIAMEANLIIVYSVFSIYLRFSDKVTMTPTVYVERTVFGKL